MNLPLFKPAALLIATLVCCAVGGSAEIDLYVLAGQSNMYGHQGDASMYPKDSGGLDRKVLFYKEGKWTSLQPQRGRFPKGHFGPEVTFARELVERGQKVAVFKYSAGSTSIARNWKAPGAGGMYDRMLADLSKARKQLQDDGHTPVIRAFIWIQGESDAETSEMAKAYGARLKRMVDHLRTVVANDEGLPVLLGVDEQHPWVKKHPQVVAAQKKVAEQDENIVFTSMIGLEKADSTHLTPSGLEAHGRRLFAAFNKEILESAKDGADQPATESISKPDDEEKSKPKSEIRSP